MKFIVFVVQKIEKLKVLRHFDLVKVQFVLLFLQYYPKILEKLLINWKRIISVHQNVTKTLFTHVFTILRINLLFFSVDFLFTIHKIKKLPGFEFNLNIKLCLTK